MDDVKSETPPSRLGVRHHGEWGDWSPQGRGVSRKCLHCQLCVCVRVCVCVWMVDGARVWVFYGGGGVEEGMREGENLCMHIKYTCGTHNTSKHPPKTPPKTPPVHIPSLRPAAGVFG